MFSLSLSSSYYYAFVGDIREDLTESCANLLVIILNFVPYSPQPPGHVTGATPQTEEPLSPAMIIQKETGIANLFLAYLSRLHQQEVREREPFYLYTCLYRIWILSWKV